DRPQHFLNIDRGVAAPDLEHCSLLRLRRELWPFPSGTSIQLACFFDQHDRDPVADRIGGLGGAGAQPLSLGAVFARAFAQRADENLEQLGIDAAGGAFRRRHGVLVAALLAWRMSFSEDRFPPFRDMRSSDGARSAAGAWAARPAGDWCRGGGS